MNNSDRLRSTSTPNHRPNYWGRRVVVGAIALFAATGVVKGVNNVADAVGTAVGNSVDKAIDNITSIDGTSNPYTEEVENGDATQHVAESGDSPAGIAQHYADNQDELHNLKEELQRQAGPDGLTVSEQVLIPNSVIDPNESQR